MLIREELQHILAKAIKKAFRVDLEPADIPIEYPAQTERGDYASAVSFVLAKQLKKKPDDIAAQIAEQLNKKIDSSLDRAVAEGAFVNLWISNALLAAVVTTRIAGTKAPKPKGKPIVVEYSGVNIGKPFSIGHLRSTVNGDAIANLLEATGHKVVRINYLGDWGTQFGKLIAGYQHWGNPEELRSEPIKELQRVYVKYHAELEKNEALLDEGREWFKRLEEGNKEALDLWQEFRDVSLAHAQGVYDLLDVHFDEVGGESDYREKTDEVLALVKKKKLLTESDGAQLVNLEKYDLPPLLLQKSDEGSLYATRELAAAIDRQKRFKFSAMLYEVGAEQELHFRQVFKVLELLGFSWVDQLEHIKHGLYRMGGGKMSTRAGKVADMRAILEEAIARAAKIIEEKNPDLEDKEQVARAVGIGAVKYNDLSQNRLTPIEFDFDRMMSLEGNSGPYLQYTHARAMSVLRKAQASPDQLQISQLAVSALEAPEEKVLVRRLVRFEEVVAEAAKKRLPHLVATEMYELASLFNSFYANIPIIKAVGVVKDDRLLITAALSRTIAWGLHLLGLAAPERL